MRSVVAVGVGAAAGAGARWSLAEAFDDPTGWPWATFVVNVVGAFLLGIVLTVTHHRVDEVTHDPVRLALGTGFCGALTTFSTLAVEVAEFGRDDRVALAAGYLPASFATGIAAFGLGRALATRTEPS